MSATPSATPWLKSKSGIIVVGYLKTFVAVILFAFLTNGADITKVSVTDLKTWVAAAFVAVLPTVINALDSNYPLYGRGSAPATPVAVVATPADGAAPASK